MRTAIQAVRQDHREALPRLFAEKFSRKLDKREWSQLHLGLGRTDIATLAGRMPLDRIRKILRDDKARETEAGKLEEKLSSLAPKAARDYLRKADELAAFMVTGRVAKNLLKNADSIAQLFGEDSRQWVNPTAETVRIIDELTTLYALGKLDGATKQTMQALAETEAEGIDFLTAYLTDLKRNERAKASFTEEARFNAWKGFIPAETRHGARLIVADDREHNKLVTTGYTRIGDYRGAGVEPGKKGYYFSRVAGNNTYHQGVMQTVNTSYFGVDPRTGYSVNGITAGRVPTNQVGVIQQRLKTRGNQDGEALIPVYDADGNVVAYERSMAPEMFAKLDRNTHLGEMIGAWAGRQVEEDLAQDYNRLLIDRLHEVWDRDRKEGREKEFVNLADPELEDPVHREAWSMVPAEARSYIREKFGDSGFMVRKDMVNNALGYREPSIGDAWISKTRLDEKTRKVLRDASMAVLGKNAFTILTTAEKGWEAQIPIGTCPKKHPPPPKQVLTFAYALLDQPLLVYALMMQQNERQGAAHNSYDNNVSRMTENVLRQFAGDEDAPAI